MARYGLIGHPIGHSLSPALFAAAYGEAHPYDLIPGEVFEESYKRFLQEYDAVNVTAPFKEDACARADVLSHECEVIGACNVLKKTDDGVLAVNTDYLGVMQCLMPFYTDLRLSPVTLVVGCGGAGKAAAYAACELGNRVVILNRTYERAEEYAVKLVEHNPSYKVKAGHLDDFRKWFRKAGVVIYTLPESVSHLDELKNEDVRGGAFWSRPKVIFEADYRAPAFAPDVIGRLKGVNEKITYVSGKEWLLHQAVEAFWIFTGREPNIPDMIKVL